MPFPRTRTVRLGPPQGGRWWLGLAWVVLLNLSAPGCKSVTTAPTADVLVPSNVRDWTAACAVLPYATFPTADTVKLHNVRNFRYLSEDDFVVQHEDRVYDLRKLESVDFVMVPFKDVPSLAHTMLSFGFSDGRRVMVSVEARLEEGEQYSPVQGALRQYELMYVVADEQDLIPLRTKHRGVDVYVYRTRARPPDARRLLEDVLARTNRLKESPEFYDTLLNNCTSNLVAHVNRVYPGRIPTWDPRLLLPGFSDRFVYELGLLDTELSFEETKRQARVTDEANRHAGASDFSTRIRR